MADQPNDVKAVQWIKLGSSQIVLPASKQEGKTKKDFIQHYLLLEIPKISPGRYVISRSYWGATVLTVIYSRCYQEKSKCKQQYKVRLPDPEGLREIYKFEFFVNNQECPHGAPEIPRPRPLRGKLNVANKCCM